MKSSSSATGAPTAASPPIPDEAASAALTGAERSDAASFMRTLLGGPKAWKRGWRGLIRQVDHQAILRQMEADASFSFNFVFMTVVAGGIATIGLLLNSPAVIIGAMLISPLMGPIVAGGIALATLDVALARRSARTLALGAFGAIAFTALIVLISPIKELTPELLARTRPNLFDLAVAILSGAAGGYAMIRGRGGAIVGVAIATALMPPLATIGYGIVTYRWPVARGALLLFVTNMVAIGLTVAIVAEWYGFGRGGLRKRFAKQAAIALLLLAPLSVPLFISLKVIAFESFAQTSIREVLEDAANALPDGQLGEVNIQFRDNAPPSVRAVIFSAKPVDHLTPKLSASMASKLGHAVDLHLVQVLETGEVAPHQLLTTDSIVQARTTEASALRSGFPFPLAAFDVDPGVQRATLVPEAQVGVDLSAWRRMEADLVRRFPGWTVTVLPPPQSLPEIRFALGSDSLDTAAQASVDTIAWAIKRWKLTGVEVIGHASHQGRGSVRLARARADQVAERLRAGGVEVAASARYPLPNQAAVEREWGYAELRSVSVVLPDGSRNRLPNDMRKEARPVR